MTTFFATFVLMLLLIGGMSVGYLIKRKALHGSCGGLAGVGIDKECDCPEPCDKRKAQIDSYEAERNQRFQKGRIL